MVVDSKIFTCKAFMLCMNFSFVISMSQLHNTIFGEYAELLLLMASIFLFVMHFALSAKFQWMTMFKIVILIIVGLIALKFSGGATLLKLILFFGITQEVDRESVLKGYRWSLIIPLLFVSVLSLLGFADLYYSGAKMAIGFGMQNPNTVPVIVLSIIVAYNLQNECYLSGKIIVTEFIISFFLYYFCKARTAGIILLCYLAAVLLLKRTTSIKRVFKPCQYIFFICAGASLLIAILFRSKTAIWLQINSVLSGRPWAWDLYVTKYGIKFFGQPIDLTIAALDNAYLRLLIQYGILTFLIYLIFFVGISRYAYKNNKTVLLLSIIAYEIYFMAEFGPVLINFCPILMYEACILVNKKKDGEQ